MSENNHASNCVLASRCTLANSKACSFQCPHFIATNSRLRASGVPADYRLVTVSNSPARAEQSKVYKSVDAYVKTFERQFEENGERIKSAYLYSESPGTGKTTTAAAILNAYLTEHYVGSLKRGRQALPVPAYMLDCNDWQTDFNQFNRPRVPDSVAQPASERYYKAMERAKTAPFVVLDDIGVRATTDAFRSDLHSIINHRVTNQMPTVYTSNLPIFYEGKREPYSTEPYDLVDVFGEKRLADRINDMCAKLNFVGTSKRGMR